MVLISKENLKFPIKNGLYQSWSLHFYLYLLKLRDLLLEIF